MFSDGQDVILTDFLQKAITITGVYYANLISKLREAIKKKSYKRKVSSRVTIMSVIARTA